MYKTDPDSRQATVSFDVDGLLVKNFFLDHVFPGIWRKYGSSFQRTGVNSEKALLERAKELHEKELNQGNHLAAFDWDQIILDILPRGAGPRNPFREELLAGLGREEPRLYPETRSILDELDSISELNLVVLTNGLLEYQREILEKCNLLEAFSSLYGPDRTGYVKPMKEAFQYVSDREKNYFLHAGDKEEDIQGARTFGVSSWLVKRSCSLAGEEYLDARREKDKVGEYADGLEPRFLSSSLEPAGKIVSLILDQSRFEVFEGVSNSS